MSRYILEGEAPTSGRYVLEEEKPQKSEGFGSKLNKEISNIPRQIGLTARYGLEGVGNTLDFFASPIRAGLNAVLPKKQSLTGLVTGQGPEDAIQPGAGQYLANLIGLPQPEGETERIVADAARLGFGSAVPIGIASKVGSATSGTTQAVAKTLAANPLQQVISGTAAGGAGGYTRETGGDDTSQMLASLAAGVAAPLAFNKTQQLTQATGKSLQRATTPAHQQAAQVDIQINRALQRNGTTLDALPFNVQSSIRNDVAAALRTNGELSPDAIARLADYRLIGAAPTRAGITLDPAIVSQQKNLAKIGINSKDAAAQQLGRVENANNRQLIDTVNSAGANTVDDAFAGGQKVINAVSGANAAAKSRIDARYAAARATDGRSAALNPSAFTQKANDLLDDSLLGGKLPGDVRNLLNKTANGEMPLTVDTAEQFKTRIGELQRSTVDMAERKALGLVRQALDDTPLIDGQGKQAIVAFNKARRLNRAWMNVVEKTPALQAVRDGVEPDKFVQQYIVGSGSKTNVADLGALSRLVKTNPEASSAIKEQIAAHLKKSALNGAADEVGNFSQSGYNKALKAIGDRKLNMFFSPEDVARLKAAGRVSSYEQFQPKGSAVNNSNTAGSAIATILDRVGNSPLLSKVPFGSFAAEPAINISVGMQAKNAMNVPNALAGQKQIPFNRQPAGLLISPAAAAFSAPEDKKKRGLLTP